MDQKVVKKEVRKKIGKKMKKRIGNSAKSERTPLRTAAEADPTGDLKVNKIRI